MLLVFVFASLVACSSLQSEVFDYPLAPNKDIDRNMQISLLGSLGMKPFKFKGLPVTELSGISWDEDEQLLYAISDEGLLYHLKLTIKNNQLEDMEIVFATRLKDKNNKRLRGKYSDSEGLSLLNSHNGKQGDSTLIISFEGKPRIALYSATGKFLSRLDIPKELRHKKNYRSKNKSLESVIQHPQYGVMTAAEFPLQKDAKTYQTVYSTTGKKWHFSASDAENSAITGMETLPNGDLLILERAWKNKFTPIVINLRQLYLKDCNNKQQCKTRKIASLSGADGWYLDNFEGLAHYKNNQYLMVSDDNNHPLQNTVLVLFEVNL